MEMQTLGMAMLADVQEFVESCKKITSFFYRNCLSLENHFLQDSIVEAVTQIMFTTQSSALHYLVRALFSAQHHDVISDLHRVIHEYTNVFRLLDMKMCQIKFEVLSFAEIDRPEGQPGSPSEQHSVDLIARRTS